MKATYEIGLLEEESGEPCRIPGESALIPSPATVQIHRSYASLAFTLRIELIGETWPVVTEMRALTATTPPQTITAAELRDMRFGQLQKACVSFLRRWASEGAWPRVELIETDGGLGLRDLVSQRENMEWMRDLPPVSLDGRGTDRQWLESVKVAGIGSERTLRAVAAIYRSAVEQGLAGNAEVERWLELPNSTASRWIERARDQGYMAKSPRKRRTDRKSDA